MYTHEIIPIESEEAWLALRAVDITSTQTAALFGLSPWQTKFEIFHAKKNNLILPFKDNERMQKGKRMEAYAAQEIAEKNGWQVRHLNIYARIPELRMGASFDYEITCPKRGKGLLEIKSVDYFRHKLKWSEEEIPPHIEIQVKQEMLCHGGYDWACVAAFTSIYEHYEYYFEREEKFEAGLINAVKSFWADVATGKEPDPDFSKDGETIAALYKNLSAESVDLTSDNELPTMIADYERFKEEEKEWGEKKDAKKAEIHHKLGNNASAFLKEGSIDVAWTKGSAGKIITESMIGQIIGAKNGYRKLLYKPYKKDAA